jgi:hypothetical protein
MLANLYKTRTGYCSTTKIWRQIAFTVATYVIIVNAKAISWEVLLVYLAVVSGSEIAKEFLRTKTGTAKPGKAPEEE